MIDDDLSFLLQLTPRLLLVRHQNEVENVLGRNTFQALFNDCEYLTANLVNSRQDPQLEIVDLAYC